MSLKYRNASGVETPVAGLNGTSGELVPSVALMQSGIATFSEIDVGAVGFVEVTLSTPMPDTDYLVQVYSDNTATSDHRFTWFVRINSASKFTIYATNTYTTALTPEALKWTAFKLMTDESRALDEARIEQNTANFAPAFSEVTSYAVGDYVTYNNILYRCTTAHTAGVWVAGHFTQVTVGGQLKVQDISSSITRGDGYASGQIHVFRDGNTVQVIFNSVMTTGYSKTICSGLPRPLYVSYFCVQADEVPQELGLGSLLEDGSIVTGTETAGMASSKVWDGFITYLTRD